eukprot:411032-Amphidinium_carterae.2
MEVTFLPSSGTSCLKQFQMYQRQPNNCAKRPPSNAWSTFRWRRLQPSAGSTVETVLNWQENDDFTLSRAMPFPTVCMTR